MEKAPTLQQIADAAGCSRMTVSLALRKDPRIPASTRERIETLAAKLGYRPNPLVAALMSQRAGKRETGGEVPLAVLNSFEEPDTFESIATYRFILDGARARALSLGYRLDFFNIHPRFQLSPARLHKILQTRGIRGVVVLPIFNEKVSVEFRWEHYAAVTLGHTLRDPAMHRVATDQYGSACKLIEALMAKGYHRLGLLLNSRTDKRTNWNFTAAFAAYHQHHPKLHPLPSLVFEDGDEAAIRKWFKQHRPDCIVSHQDDPALLQTLEAPTPDSTGYASLNRLSDKTDGTSGIWPRFQEVGTAAIEVVVSRLQRGEFGLPRYPRITMIEGEWINGVTTP